MELESLELAHKMEWWTLCIFQNSTGRDLWKSKVVCLGFPENSKFEKLRCFQFNFHFKITSTFLFASSWAKRGLKKKQRLLGSCWEQRLSMSMVCKKSPKACDSSLIYQDWNCRWEVDQEMSVLQTNSRWWELWVWIRDSKRRIGKMNARGLCCRHKSIIGHVPICHFWRVTRQSLSIQLQSQTSVLCSACCRLTNACCDSLAARISFGF